MMRFKDYMWENDKRYRFLLFAAIFILIGVSIFEAIKNNNYFLLGNLQKLNNDDVRYLNTAKILLEKHQLFYYGVKTAFIMPMYPLFLSGIMFIFGTGDSGITAIRIIQALMQGVSLYFVYLSAKQIFNKQVAIISAFLFALYLPEEVAPNLILTEVLFQFLFIIMVYFAIVAVQEKKAIYYVITSIFWALTCLTRPNAAIFPLFIIIFWIIKKYKWKDMLKYTLIAFSIFVIFFTPWWIRNYKLTNHFVLFTDSSANPKLLGSFIFYQQPSFWDEIPTKYGSLKYERKEYMSNTQQNELANYIIKTGFKVHPVKYTLWYTAGKTIMLYYKPYYWRPILGVNIYVMWIIHLIYIILSLMGIRLILLNKTHKRIMLLVLLAMVTIVYWPFITFARYGFPNMYLMIILAAYSINYYFFKNKTTY